MFIPRALVAFLVFLAAAMLRADFSGDFGVGAPGSHNFDENPSPYLGSWSSSFSESGGAGGVAIIDTNGAPDQVYISITGHPGGTASVGFIYNQFTTAGTLSFNLTGSLAVSLDNVLITSGDGNYSFAVNPNQELAFRFSATGTTAGPLFNQNGQFIGMSDNVQETKSGTISNFGFAAIPEPSTYAVAAGVCALGLGIARRRRG